MKKNKIDKPLSNHPFLHYNANDMNNEVWLTVQQVMQNFKISKSTVYRLSKKHAIPSYKLGNMRMYPKNLINRIFITQSLKNIKDFNNYNLD
ncbi:helix-turn-helix domain-containing protein [Polaribacter vadi]|uniref:helix-turn-helix domain-containing protein n=1 Tax=Polaribacter TaxID=52959 RepID=UPI001C099B55|nr:MULTISPECIES: helix-turn-helix domain-containing protein [Polaribacter]MBU3013110.1 helix-turn-helix domain-containing protein [Polaribacter vadi]MDO6742930.1 helix-turn-helix domain-containing protein [Polaribacter sp. 1_MG-2023]